MTEPLLPPPPEEPHPALVRDDPIAWRWVVLTAIIALVGLVTTVVVVQHRHSAPATTTATRQATSLQLVSAAAAKTATLNASHMDMSMTVRGPGQQFTFRFGGDIGRHPAQGRLTGTLPAGFGRLDERFLGHTLYLSVGGHTLTGGKHWVGMHVAGLRNAFGGGSDPLTMLRTISTARGVTEIGTATVRGVETTEYRADIDLASIASRLPSQFRVGDPAALHGTATMDIFVAADGTARKVVEHLGLGGLTMTFVATVTPIAHVATVVAPPASDVVRVTNLQDALRAFGSAA